MLLREVSECQVLVADHEPDFALVGVAPHPATETPEPTEAVRIGDVCGRGVAVNDDGLVLDQHATLLVIAPDTAGAREGSGSAVELPKGLERLAHPVVLVDRRHPVALHAWHEEYHQDGFSTDLQP